MPSSSSEQPNPTAAGKTEIIRARHKRVQLKRQSDWIH